MQWESSQRRLRALPRPRLRTARIFPRSTFSKISAVSPATRPGCSPLLCIRLVTSSSYAPARRVLGPTRRAEPGTTGAGLFSGPKSRLRCLGRVTPLLPPFTNTQSSNQIHMYENCMSKGGTKEVQQATLDLSAAKVASFDHGDAALQVLTTTLVRQGRLSLRRPTHIQMFDKCTFPRFPNKAVHCYRPPRGLCCPVEVAFMSHQLRKESPPVPEAVRQLLLLLPPL